MPEITLVPIRVRRGATLAFRFDGLKRLQAVLRETFGLVVVVASVGSFVCLLEWVAGFTSGF